MELPKHIVVVVRCDSQSVGWLMFEIELLGKRLVFGLVFEDCSCGRFEKGG